VDCKQTFNENLNQHLTPFRARRSELAENPNFVWDILADGQQRASAIARSTIRSVKDAIGLP
jgi:tryptophanyl-tRNA synthetase